VHVALTDAGIDVIDNALPDHLANEQRLLAALTNSQRNTLADNLRRLLESLGDVRE
jgi:DNA-binding MarR family transcriptional regulator